MNPLLAFYLGNTDDQGRFLNEILEWDDRKLESVHNYIQWVFPTVDKSYFNLKAPTLDEETIEIWKQCFALQKKLLQSVCRYLEFLERNFHIWVCPMDHNHLRITRMLKCMMVLGLEDQAKSIFNWLEDVAMQSDIDSHSLEYWREAIEVPTHPTSSRSSDY